MSTIAGCDERLVFTVLSREWCHLCHDMIAALEPIAETFGWRVDVVDVDSDPGLEARWNELVPVLLDGSVEICHWHLDPERVVQHCLARAPAEIAKR